MTVLTYHNGSPVYREDIDADLRVEALQPEPLRVPVPAYDPTLVECDCGDEFVTRLDMGLHLGYPSCCVEYYLSLSTMYDLGLEPDNRTTKLWGSGFAPCPTHDEFSEAELITLVNENRSCLNSFLPWLGRWTAA
jgi:hypothetical protein